MNAQKIAGLDAGKHLIGDGLYLHKRSKEAGRWAFHFRFNGKRHEMGLGPYPKTTLGQAKTKHRAARVKLDAGENPIAPKVAKPKIVTVQAAADATFEKLKPTLRHDGKYWYSPLRVHVLPKLGKRDVTTITAEDIETVLDPIWRTKPDTAEKAFQRFRMVMRRARVMTGRKVDLTIFDDAKELLGPIVKETKHIPAMPLEDLPKFYAETLNGALLSHDPLKLIILTAMRSAPVRNARVEQFDLDAAVWTIPADLMKGQKKDNPQPFRVPLSDEALALVTRACEGKEADDLLFPSARGKVLSDMTLSRFMERQKLDSRPHGFRSTFRDWCDEVADVDWHVAETALGHLVGGKTERAYKRGDLLEKRRAVMQSWADVVTGKSNENVISLVGS